VNIASRKLNMLFLGVIILLIGWVYFYPDMSDVRVGWEYRMAVFSAILFMYYLIVWRVMQFRVVSPTFFVLLSMWLFHITLVIVMGFKLHEYNPSIMLYRYGDQNTFDALVFSHLIITFYIFGLIIYSEKTKVTKEVLTRDDYIDIIICRQLGVIFLLISILPTIYSNYVQVSAKIAEGYSGTMSADTSFHGIPLGWFTKLFLPGILLILSSFKNNRTVFMRIMLIVIIYYLLFMFFTGRKGNTIQTVAPLLVMYFYYFNPKIKIRYLFFAYLGLYLVNIVTATREMGVNGEFWSQVQYFLVESNPIVDLMFEMGGTIKAVIQMQMAVPQTGSLQFGTTYIYGFIVSIAEGLNLSIAAPYNQYAIFANYLALPERGSLLNASVASMGGSSIAEWWWNFGWFSIIAVLLFAKLVLLYENTLIKSLENPVKFAMWCSFLYYLMRYTRGYITDMIWDPIFVFCCISIAYSYLKKKSYLRESLA